jgi:ubiquinone/menaquinone biosynthesis C-methylase UbiE
MGSSGGTRFDPGPGYDRAADTYDLWGWQSFWTRNEEPIVESMLRSLPLPETAVDLGAGTGRYCDMLCRLGVPRVVGVDISRGMLDVARRKWPSIAFVNGDISALPLVDSCAQVAIAARTLSHVPDVEGVLGEIARIMRPGGLVIVTDLHAEHPFDATKLPTPGGEIAIATWKRTESDVVSAATRVGLETTHVRRITAKDCVWLPPPQELLSLDRTGARAVFFVASFIKP